MPAGIKTKGTAQPTHLVLIPSPEWGEVPAFSLEEAHRVTYERDGYPYQIFHDPGAPPTLDTTAMGGKSEEYKWGFSLVSAWSSDVQSSPCLLK